MRISRLMMNLVVLAAIPLGLIVLLVPYGLVWGLASLRAAWDAWLAPPLALGALVLGLALHEALHGLGWSMFRRGRWPATKMSLEWDRLTPYVRCREPLPIAAFRRGLLLPALVLGLVPVILGLAFGQGLTVLFGVVMFVTSADDFAIWWALRVTPANAYVLSRLGRDEFRIIME